MSKRNDSIWSRVDYDLDYAPVVAQATTDAKTEEEKASSRRETQRLRRICDAVASFLWVYAFLKVFVFDVDRAVVEAIVPGADWLVSFRPLIFLAVIATAALLIRKPMQLVVILVYVAVFPLVVLLWKLPRAIYKSGSWVFFFGVLNALSSLVMNLRYGIVFVASAAIGITLIAATDHKVTLGMGAAILVGLLVVSVTRTVGSSLLASKFVSVQSRAIERIVGSGRLRRMIELNADLRRQDLVKFSPQQQATFVQQLSHGVLTHRLLYFWAYQLEQYRKSPGSVVLSAVSYITLLGTLVVVLSLTNLAIYKADPSAFAYSSDPSAVTFVRYAISALWGNEIDALKPANGLTETVSVIAFILGVVVFVTLLLTLFVSYRQQRDQTAMQEVVAKVKRQGQELDRQLRKEYEISASEALNRLADLKAQMLSIILFFSDRVPPEFEAEEHAAEPAAA
jgi:hypothetical protein